MVQRFVSFTNLLMHKTTLLFFATALCEIVGCYLPWLWLKRGATPLLLIPTALALALFVWLLTLHPAASGRVYAAYGGCTFVPHCSGCGSLMGSN
ncbi:Upf0060 membrane protein [Klebsiella pneumoniae]|nr:Upf0060 membrane protein [Klebsiella pneumoniae]BBE55921.1 UPF0060 membrane protein YnfA [Klebsiella pneumoniae]BBE61600.1 UPF0060 membrane protein YnfA [Klebsiella pneumoniae]BBE67191.1 UPF0060 membrane protein YnfA [Klebsiella pneumoniae]